MQVLFAFLLVVPFNQRFADLSAGQERLYLFTLLSAGFASALLIAPTAQHRITFREQEKEYIVRMGNRLTVAGLAFLALSMTAAIGLVVDVVFSATTAIVSAALDRAAVRRALVRAAARAAGARPVSSLWTEGAPELHAPPLRA